MGHRLRFCKRFILAATVCVGGLLGAEPIIITSPAEPSSSQGQTPVWLPESEDAEPQPVAAPVLTDKTTTPQPGLVPAARPLQAASAISNTPRTGVATPVPADAPVARGEGVGQDVRNAVKDAIRPLYQELSESGVAGTLRGLQHELGFKKDQELGRPESTPGSTSTGHGTPQAASWETPGQHDGHAAPPKTAAQTEKIKLLESVMLAKLIDDAIPWLVGLVAAYVLFYAIKFTIAFGKYHSARRLQHRQRRSRTTP